MSYVWSENLGRAHRVAAAIEAGMCFVNSQNVRDLRQPFGGTKASGTGREGGTWSYEVFLEPKNVCVSLGSHHIPHWGAGRHEPVPDAEIPVRHQPRSDGAAAGSRTTCTQLLARYDLTAEERGAIAAGDIGLILRSRCERPAPDALRRVSRHAVGGLHRRDARRA